MAGVLIEVPVMLLLVVRVVNRSKGWRESLAEILSLSNYPFAANIQAVSRAGRVMLCFRRRELTIQILRRVRPD